MIEQPSKPSPTRTPPPSRRADIFITLLGLVSLGLFLVFYDRAFPQAAIDLELGRSEVAQRAQDYAKSQGYELDDYEFTVTFASNSWASYYLQHVLGIPETNRLIQQTQVPIWYWRARWFRPLQKEEFRVYVTPDGQVMGLSHTLLEDAPGATLSQEQAQTLAQNYLVQDRGWDLTEWEPVSASSEDRPGGRTDHAFEWKRGDWDVGKSELRLAVTVRGDEVGYYHYWIKVPEVFQRDFTQQQNIAGFINTMSLILSIGLFGLILFVGFYKSGRQMPVPPFTADGPTLAVVVIVLLSGINELGLVKAGYSTTQSYMLFWLMQGIGILFRALFSGILVWALWYLGHWMSKRNWSRQDKVLSCRGDRWHTLARSGWRGLMLGSMMAGYVVLFYLAATRLFGGWTPMSPNYTYAYATPLPFWGALESGLLPAMWEELMFRLLLISGVLWLTRTFTKLPDPVCRFLALLIPGALWGFGHVSYIRDPIYLRGIELTLAAILLEGFFFLRFDLTTTIVAHFMYNAGLTAIPLLRSDEPYFVASGLVVVATMFIPVIPGLAREIRRRIRRETRDILQPHIRPAGAQDLDALAALPIKGLDWETMVNDTAAVIVCLQAGGDVIGVAAGRIEGEGIGQVLAVVVTPPWRRQYWGSELTEALRVQLQEQGAQSIDYKASIDDKMAMGFWSSLGWRVTEMVFRWPPTFPPSPSWRDRLARAFKRQGDDHPTNGGVE